MNQADLCKCGQSAVVGFGKEPEMLCLECFKGELNRAYSRMHDLCQAVGRRVTQKEESPCPAKSSEAASR